MSRRIRIFSTTQNAWWDGGPEMVHLIYLFCTNTSVSCIPWMFLYCVTDVLIMIFQITICKVNEMTSKKQTWSFWCERVVTQCHKIDSWGLWAWQKWWLQLIPRGQIENFYCKSKFKEWVEILNVATYPLIVLFPW